MSAKGGAIKDKWKMKKWYSVITPKAFGEVSLGSTPAYDITQTIGRRVETTLYDLTGDFSQVYVHLYFKIIGNEGDRLITRFVGHELSRDYLRSLIRRKSSKINSIFDVTTKDGYVVRVKGLVLTTYKCHQSQKTAIRKIINETVSKKASELSFDDFTQEVVFGRLANEIFEAAKKIYPLRKAEIEKTKVLKVPENLGKQVESSSVSSG
ncbi:30S ribosomal protein S3ae [Saccharolobus solfataricus]|uniref:Small ribosomal subunit protein eS1 n=3 Tax=Saccharolobus solfataricus TaxID=2287 RepID=RS3A_SACS2|nr:30S ribosomal protein S3ae [Saccharolobus solfataricus]Q9UXD4.1 RecName: Full=Small ribosomal subunit protein eS1; AltName: Full=30S ribosomal protein S3Ae; AltName: Full=Ribosomal protein S1e [Saccharolobus solfataricus P2]AAK41041.1 SSU ribosomal protein S3AE (rps3AE) [Saccharolobus solfataricus P2]AKA74068.1 30S ribosomal protein S3ae [Saccharolobus solfataricus]AKA76765.1 30S ribosomal protein S3ae [Saccharolobus solfataricus]AKA79459.1 30S ribosomal protein S3ae [Saccharolobus solfatar